MIGSVQLVPANKNCMDAQNLIKQQMDLISVVECKKLRISGAHMPSTSHMHTNDTQLQSSSFIREPFILSKQITPLIMHYSN